MRKMDLYIKEQKNLSIYHLPLALWNVIYIIINGPGTGLINVKDLAWRFIEENKKWKLR